MPRWTHAKPPVNPTEVDWARLAAFIDGEGCILLGAHKNPSKYGEAHYDHVRVIVANTDPRLMLWLRERFGGKILRTYKRADKPDWRHGMKWYVSCQVAIELLRGCYPYLICKRDQAEIAFAFQETVGRPGVKGHPPEVYAARQELKERLTAMRWKQYSEDQIHDLADWGNRVN